MDFLLKHLETIVFITLHLIELAFILTLVAQISRIKTKLRNMGFENSIDQKKDESNGNKKSVFNNIVEKVENLERRIDGLYEMQLNNRDFIFANRQKENPYKNLNLNLQQNPAQTETKPEEKIKATYYAQYIDRNRIPMSGLTENPDRDSIFQIFVNDNNKGYLTIYLQNEKAITDALKYRPYYFGECLKVANETDHLHMRKVKRVVEEAKIELTKDSIVITKPLVLELE